MKIGRFMLSMLATAAVMLFATSFAQAQNNRSWVSSTGDDNAACTRAAPCRTFQGALAKTNQQGEIDAIDAAEYGNNASNVGAISSTSTLTIGKSVTIDGNGLGFITGGNGSTPTGDAVQITTADVHDVVTFRSLSINGAHFGGTPSAFFDGVHFLTGTRGAVVLERTRISNFSRAGVNFEPDAGGNLFVRDCDFTNNEFFGIRTSSVVAPPGAAFASIDNVRVSNNGIFGTGSGFVFLGTSKVNLSDSVSAYNGLNGIQVTGGANPASANMESSQFVGNNINVQAGFGGVGTIRMSNIDVFDATASGLSFTGGSNVLSFGNNRIANNIGSNGPPSGTLPQQ